MDRSLFLKMIDAAIKGNTLESVELDNDFLRVAKEQTFLPMIYPVFKNQKYKKYYIQSCFIHEQFEKVGDIIYDLFSKNEINHIFLKGQVVKYFYNDPNIRMQGDIDVLVDEKDFAKSIELFEKAGFKKLDDVISAHHIEFTYQGILIELHRSLFDDGENKMIDKFFNDYFSHTESIKDYSYRFEPNYNFVYLIAHYARHFKLGAGLRELCDLYYMLTKFDLDDNYISLSLKSIGLDEFYNTILNELNIIFNYKGKPFTPNVYANELIDFSLKCGIHGFGQDNNFVQNQIQTQGNGSKFKFLLKKLFVPLKTLFVLYPWTKSIILIPFGYLARLFYLLFKRKDRLKETIKAENKENNLFTKVGL